MMPLWRIEPPQRSFQPECLLAEGFRSRKDRAARCAEALA